MADLLPSVRYELAGFAELVADPSRTAILLSLMDGSARPATELAAFAGVTPQTTSSHLHRLVEGGLLALERIGRHRYYRLANERVADALEAMVLIRPLDRKLLPSTPERTALSEARTCYLHLAGRLGVAWLDALEKRRFIHFTEGALEMTSTGMAHFASIDMEAPRWPAGKPCLDWTERRSHLGGALGALLTKHLFARGWLARRNESRAVRVTTRGARGFDQYFSLRWLNG